MGLFDKIRVMKQAHDAGGNFAFIAQIFATQHYIFSRTEYSQQLLPEERWFAVAAINTMIPLQTGRIQITDIADAVKNSEFCKVYLHGYSRSWGLEYVSSENERLFNILLQIEALTFKAYSKLDDQEIVTQVLSHMDSIWKEFKSTLSQGQNSPVYKDAYEKVFTAAADPGFQNLVSKYLDYCYGD